MLVGSLRIQRESTDLQRGEIERAEKEQESRFYFDQALKILEQAVEDFGGVNRKDHHFQIALWKDTARAIRSAVKFGKRISDEVVFEGYMVRSERLQSQLQALLKFPFSFGKEYFGPETAYAKLVQAHDFRALLTVYRFADGAEIAEKLEDKPPMKPSEINISDADGRIDKMGRLEEVVGWVRPP